MLRSLAARAYCWWVQRAWYGGRINGTLLPVFLESTDGGHTFTDHITGEIIDRDEVARRLAPHMRPYLHRGWHHYDPDCGCASCTVGGPTSPYRKVLGGEVQ